MRLRAPAGVAALIALLAAWVPGAVRAAPGGDAAGEACGALAARYEGGKAFKLSVIRAGEVRIVNPLRPLTPEVTQVLEVVIGGKRATAYGPDFTTLHRGGPPGAMQASLGAPIHWEPALPPLPTSLGIVGEDGTPLADLAFRACETPPAAAPEPAPVAKKNEKTRGGASAGKKAGAQGPPAGGGATPGKAGTTPGKAAKTPGGFTLPQGAIAQ